MAYSGVTNTLALLPGFPQTTTAEGYTAATTMLGNQVVRADSVIDGMLSERYAIPLNDATAVTDAVPPVIRTISQDLVRSYAIHAFFTADNVNVSEYADRIESRAMTFLKRIADGKAKITLTNGSLLPLLGASGRVASTTEDHTPTYLEDEELNQIVDSDKLDSIRSDRA